MRNINMIKSFLIPLLAMGLTSVGVLFVVSVLTYLFKWQAPQALVGITFAYILTGFVGGVLQGILEGFLELRERVVHGLVLGSGYMIVLLILSVVLVEKSGWDYVHLLMIWILLACSSVLGGFLSNIFCKKP